MAAHAVVAAVGETAFSRSELRDSTPGRPGLGPIAGLSVATVLVRSHPLRFSHMLQHKSYWVCCALSA